ncbi:MAG: preprotein translocase subunit SecG [Pseudomonadota bacterium]
MLQILLVIHLMISIALVAVVLLQRNEGGGLGIGGPSLGNLSSVRGTGNILTRLTAILAALFMAGTLVLAIVAGQVTQPSTGGLITNTPAPVEAPAEESEPVVPLN